MAALTLPDDRYRDHVIQHVYFQFPSDDPVVTTGTPSTVKETELDSRAVAFDRDLSTLNTEGTTAIYHTNSVDALRATCDQSVMQYALELAALASTTGTTGASVVTWYTGDFLTRYYGLRVVHTAVDLDNGALVYFETVVPKVQIQDFDPFQGGATRKAITAGRVVLNAIKTTTDLLGVDLMTALAGTPAGQTTVPAGGVFFYRRKLSGVAAGPAA